MSGLIGAKEMEQWAEKAIRSTEKRIVSSFNKAGDGMVKDARSRHKFTTRTGSIDNSITSEVDHKKGDYISLTFFIDPTSGGILTSGGYNKGWMMNDGTFGSYSRGLISPTASTVGGAKGTGWKGDDFMGKAWSRGEKQLMKSINKAMDGIQ